MTPEKISSLISIFVAISILIASYFQWWDITWNGGMKTRKWVKLLFVLCILLLIISGGYVFAL
jgi:hypothetical protein